MKKISIAILALLAVLLTACSTTDEETKIVPDNNDVAGDDDIGAVIELKRGSITWSGDSVRVTEIKQSTCYYAYSYRTLDANGDSIRLTALIGWEDGNIVNVHPSTLLIGCHITITDNKQAPTNFTTRDVSTDVGMLLMHSIPGSSPSGNALVILPDYEGYGGTIQRPHPYLCQQLTARQVVDAVRAGMKFFKQKGGKMADGWQGITAGYSQGGAVAMATHRMIEQSGRSDEFHFRGSVCGDGPYDLPATFRHYVSTGKVYMPVVLPLILQGLCSNSKPLKNYRPEDFLTPAFLQTDVLNMISGKDMSTGKISDKLEQYADEHPGTIKFLFDDEGTYLETSAVLRPECIAYLKGEAVSTPDQMKMEALMQSLEENSVWGTWQGYDNWQPLHPIIAFHSTNDEVVPYTNYTQAQNYFTSFFNGKRYDTTFLCHHVTTGYVFFLYYCTAYLNEILEGKSSAANNQKDA